MSPLVLSSGVGYFSHPYWVRSGPGLSQQEGLPPASLLYMIKCLVTNPQNPAEHTLSIYSGVSHSRLCSIYVAIHPTSFPLLISSHHDVYIYIYIYLYLNICIYMHIHIHTHTHVYDIAYQIRLLACISKSDYNMRRKKTLKRVRF